MPLEAFLKQTFWLSFIEKKKKQVLTITELVIILCGFITMGGAINNQSKVGLPMICKVYDRIMVNFSVMFSGQNKTKLNGVELLICFMTGLTEPLKTLIQHQIKQRIT